MVEALQQSAVSIADVIIDSKDGFDAAQGTGAELDRNYPVPEPVRESMMQSHLRGLPRAFGLITWLA